MRVDGIWGGLRRVARTTTARAGRRLRTRWRSALSRASRMTGATVAAFVVAELVGLRDPPPLIAALTALLVVQATLAGTLVNGVQRVLSVVAGVALAVLFVSVVGLTWWSLGVLVAASIVVGQLLRLGPHLVEVPISAMLVLGVGHAAGAESIGSGRVVETLVGAIVGVLVNIAFPPPVRTRDASGAVAAFADEIAALLSAAADALGRGPIAADLAMQWLEDARRLNRHSPRLDRVLVQLEESRRLNLRALRHPQEGGLRSNLDALEHSSVSMRALFRAVHDTTERRTGVQDDPEYAENVRCSTAVLMADMATVFRAFGRCASGRVAWHGRGGTRRAGERAGNAAPPPRRARQRTYQGPPYPAWTVGAERRAGDDSRPDAPRARRHHDHSRPGPASHGASARQAANGGPRRHSPTRLASRPWPRTARVDRTPVTRSPMPCGVALPGLYDPVRDYGRRTRSGLSRRKRICFCVSVRTGGDRRRRSAARPRTGTRAS